MKASFHGDMGELIVNEKLLDERIQPYLNAVADFRAREAEGWMKTNAPWTDRTSAARGGLSARGEKVTEGISILLFHRVPYGIWLEVIQAGRFAIVTPALTDQSQKLMRSLEGLFRRLGK